ncbi:MAG TPA: multiheme c-type cytochrome [Thermoanaerobaculia bacterium]|nr:multiheme c-type cytochrome [Thermoanaerobaculia bacterium]
MSKRGVRTLGMSAAIAAGLILLWLPVSGVAKQQGQEPAQPAAQPPVMQPGKYLGAASCGSSNCHGSTIALDQNEVLQNEYLTWLDGDPHSTSYNVLFNEESALIAKNMGLEGPAYEAQVCLDCHTTNVPARLQENRIDLDEGVSCEVCHGPASGWLAGHVEAEWEHRDSVQNGMIDLRSISRRAQVCTGCHIGKESVQVDHELIASGHPELIFELDNYTGALPQHWKYRTNRHGVRAWAVGQVASFKQGLELLAARAESDRWPEFADMSCLACHHSLETSEWRQVRGYRYRAGLPPWSPARWVVLRKVVGRFAPSQIAELDRRVQEIDRDVALMNRPAQVAENAEAIVAALAGVLPQVQGAQWSANEAKALIGEIAGDGDYLRTTDVQSAEQALFAVNSLVSYLAEQDRSVLNGPLARAVERLDRQLANRYRFEWDQFTTELAQLRASL